MTKSQSDYNSLNKDQLIDLVKRQEEELKTKKYGLVWDNEKEPEKVVTDCENNIPVLQRIKDKRIKTNDSDDNILIEGDNYHALTCLNYTHKGKIDVIYIDPPYNTGKKNEWVYNDKFVDKEDGYRHSKWLNMMEKRLKTAKHLLKKDGIIFISINDHECYQLKILLDSIFGYENFIDNFIIRSNPRGNQAKKLTASEHEYILSYAKDYNSLDALGFSKEMEEYKKKDNIGFYREIGLRKRGAGSRRVDAPNQFYPIYYNANTQSIDINRNNEHDIKILPMLSNGEEGRWRWSFKTVTEKRNKLLVRLVNRNGTKEYDVFEKDYFDYNKISKIKSIFYEKDVNYENATEEVNNIIGLKKFDYPKPLYLIIKLLKSVTKNDLTILDFFAGSGTTGHAVLDLNKQDGGKRKFILCTNNELNGVGSILSKENPNEDKEKFGICQRVTYPRIHNVIKGYKFTGKDKTTLFEKKLSFSGLKDMDKILSEIDEIITTNKDKYDKIEKEFKDNLIKITGIKNIKDFKDGLGGNLQYFKTDLIPIRKEDDEESIKNIGDKTRRELTYKAGQMIAIKENCFEEIELNEYYQIFENNDKSKKVAIYFREDEGGLKELTKKIKDQKTTLYIFSHGKIDKKSYKYLGNNIKIEDIPEPILEIYREINLTLKD
jgi:adenine-specific DNA-methyltransferase